MPLPSALLLSFHCPPNPHSISQEYVLHLDPPQIFTSIVSPCLTEAPLIKAAGIGLIFFGHEKKVFLSVALFWEHYTAHKFCSSQNSWGSQKCQQSKLFFQIYIIKMYKNWKNSTQKLTKPHLLPKHLQFASNLNMVILSHIAAIL